MLTGRVEEAEVSNEERSKMNDQVFQQMEQEVGLVMAQVALSALLRNGLFVELTDMVARRGDFCAG